MDNDEHIVDERERIQQQADEYLNGWKRALADFDNYKKESAHRNDEFRSRQIMEIVEQLLPIYDMHHEALKHVPESYRSEAWYQGFSHLEKQWQSLLRSYDVTVIVTDKATFDPLWHEAVEIKHDLTLPDNIVLSSLRDGYQYKGMLIRPARVIVNAHASTNEIDHDDLRSPPAQIVE